MAELQQSAVQSFEKAVHSFIHSFIYSFIHSFTNKTRSSNSKLSFEHQQQTSAEQACLLSACLGSVTGNE